MNIQFITHIDVTWLAASVLHKDRESLWKIAGPDGDGRLIFLRGPEGLTDERWIADEPSVDYQALTDWPAAKSAMAKVHKALPATQLKVRGHASIQEILPGHGTPWRASDNDYEKAHVRLIVPLVSNPFVYLYSGAQSAHVEVGSLIQFNHRLLHSGVNAGTHRAIFLTVDYRATE